MKEGIFEEGELFISDIGKERYEKMKEAKEELKRYAVIRSTGTQGQLQILEVGDDLEYLMEKYKLTSASIGRIADAGSKI